MPEVLQGSLLPLFRFLDIVDRYLFARRFTEPTSRLKVSLVPYLWSRTFSGCQQAVRGFRNSLRVLSVGASVGVVRDRTCTSRKGSKCRGTLRDNCVWHSLSRVDAFVERALYLSFFLLPHLLHLFLFSLLFLLALWPVASVPDIKGSLVYATLWLPACKVPA